MNRDLSEDRAGRTPEEVVLLDEAGRATGTAPKATVHTTETPLHLAFSCYVFDGPLEDPGSLLITRRAEHKPTWPGVWTNTVCGHPAPDEALRAAVRRRARQELGVELTELRLVLPGFRYTAVMESGVRENEMCPVFVGSAAPRDVRPDPEEVAEAAWVPWRAFAADVLGGSRAVSPWCVDQVVLLDALGAQGFPAADPAELPPAARVAQAH